MLARIVNAATDLGALIIFAVQGAPLRALGTLVGAANVVGAYQGEWTAVARGSGFVPAVFLIVVAALVVKLGAELI